MPAAVMYRPRVFDLVLDKHSTIPLYLQLKYHIVHLISSGEWQPGMSLPSVRQLASDLGLATATVQRTYGELQAQGLLVGQTGRGVYVADLTTGVPDLSAERSEALRGLLARVVSHARSLGFADEEISSSMRDLLGGAGRNGASPPPRVVFVGPLMEVADKYSMLLREPLAGLGVVVEGLLLSELEEKGDVALDPLEPIRCLVSTVGVVPDLRRLAGHRGTPVFGLVVDLTEETQHLLVQLPDDVRIGLVAEERYLPSARSLVRHFRGSEDQITWAGHRNRAALGRILRDCPIILHTLGSKRLLEGRVPAGTRLIELRYRPNPASLARLRALLSAEGDRPSVRPAVAAPNGGPAPLARTADERPAEERC
jgi:GntR family transcriptional regulator